MKSTDFSSVTDLPTPDAKLEELTSIMNRLIDLYCPLKKVKPKDKDYFPWFNSTLLAFKIERDFLFSKWTQSRARPDWLAYKTARQQWQKSNRTAMIEYYKDKGMSDFKNSKKFWQFYKASIRIKSDIPASNCPNLIRNGTESATNPEQIADMFNTFFTSIESSSQITVDEGTKAILKQFKRLNEEKKLSINTTFTFRNVSESEVEHFLSQSTSSCSPGYNGIHPKFLKLAPSKLVPIITDLFNSCIDNCTVPKDWKFAIVTPLFKKGDESDINNYRGISVLPFLAKLFEKIIAQQITAYFQDNNYFFSGQHGFRKSHSCETALHELLSDLNVARDQRKIIMLLFIDFKKAFDTVDSTLLLAKLGHYGFDNGALKLIDNYFKDRMQTIKQWDRTPRPSTNQPRPVKLGIAQGSSLGPLFFLIFINDLPYLLELLAKLFADDTTFYHVGDELTTLLHDFNERLTGLFEWCAVNRLDINWKKTFAMFITNKRVTLPSTVTLNGISIDVVTNFKLLGVTIDNKLSFSSYVSSICRIVNTKLFSIKRLFYLSTSVKLQFFKSFIMPYFDYCSTLFVYFPKAEIQRLSNLYYMCLFKLFKFNFASDSNETNIFLQKYGLSSFQHRIFVRLAIFSHSIYTCLDSPPSLKRSICSSNVVDLINDSSIDKKQLRSRQVIIVNQSNLKFGELTFEKQFGKLLNKCIGFTNLLDEKSTFIFNLLMNIDIFFDKFINQFLKFNLDIKNFSYMVT